MNLAVNPCDDFYAYACGSWIEKTEIPADRPRWSRSFDVINARNEDTLHTLLEAIAHGQAPAGDYPKEKLAALYVGCMDAPQHEASLPKLKAIAAKEARVTSVSALPQVLGRLHAKGVDTVFSFSSTQDLDDATQVIGEVDQSGLSLPDRDYYLLDDAKMKTVRDAYAKHLVTMFGLWGETAVQAQASASAVLDVETQLARASMDRVSRRNPENLHHRIDRTGLKKTSPAFRWDAYFQATGSPTAQAINVTSPAYVSAVNAMLAAVKPQAWTAYLTWHFMHDHVIALPKVFQDENFRFVSTQLSGAKEDVPRWKKCVRLTDALLGEALAVPFVNQTFGADGKAKALAVVGDIETAFERNLDSLDWMDSATKAKALEKVRKVDNKIGYPVLWRRYDAVKGDVRDFAGTANSASAAEHARLLAKIGKPLERREWLMTPPTVNAYYNPPMNEVVFPAGILQPPFFSREASMPVNFGGIGMVVGHEFTHGFDDEGRLYDAVGNLKTWWTDAANKAFEKKAECVKKQYSGYLAIDDIHLNGALTLGENVADLGGLKLSHAAMRSWVKANPAEAKVDAYRFSPDQQFFLGFAQSWCSKERPELRRMLAKTDPHSPPQWRVKGPISGLPAFADAFHCAANAPMVRPPAEACQVW